MSLIFDTITGVLLGLPVVLPALAISCLGALVAWALGVRDLAILVVASTPVAFGSLLAVAQLLGWLGTGGPRLTAGVLVAAALAATFGGPFLARWSTHLRTFYVQRPARPGALPRAVWLVAGLAGLLSLAAWLPGFGDIGLPPQGNDDIWHGYLATRLTEMPTITAADVAPVTVGSADPVTVYPYGLHFAVAVASALTGFSVPTAMNGMWAVYTGLLLPLGSAVLCWQLLPGKRVAACVAAVSAVLFNVFPYALNGVMPYAVTLAFVPALLAVLAARAADRRTVPAATIAFVALGIFVSHPAVAVAGGIVGVLVVAEIVIREQSRVRALAGLGVPAVLTLAVCLPWIIRNRTLGAAASGAAAAPGTGEGYTAWAALRMVLTQASPWTPGQPALAVLVLIGLVVAVATRRAWSVAVGYGIFAALFVAVLAGIPALTMLTGPWYGNWHRLIAVSAAVAPVLIGGGVTWTADAVLRLARGRRTSAPLGRIVLAAGIVVAVIASMESAKYVLRGQSTVASAWKTPRLVTADDVLLFERLARLTEARPGEQVLNNWPDGSTWMYAVAGVRPAVPYAATTTLVPAWSAALAAPSAIGTSPELCRLLLDNDVGFAIGKRVGLAGTGGTLEQSLRQAPELFTPLFSNPAGTIFRLDRQALRDCIE